MIKSVSLSFKKGDILAVVIVAALAAAVFLCFLPGNSAGKTAEVYMDGVLIKTVDLHEDAEFTVQGEYKNVISVSGGSISIIDSDCPGEDCVHTGGISSPGRSIVCLPNRLEIRISGDEGGVDAVVR